ncbi:MAG TPA: hypothetical protein VJ464_23855 [Blastocatellia bacterium]|nr:hypothetical protein [Blastocatellia bacterium]
MTSGLPTKRKRGGQPGNRNSKGKGGAPYGNQNARGNHGGAPRGNRNACKKPQPPHLILLEDYQNYPLAIAWIQANAEALDEANFTADHQRDRALFAVYRGLTIEAIVKHGKEYEYGLYSLIDSDDDQQVKRAA